MSRFYTPLRYPGGKAKFAPIIESFIKHNGLNGGHYLEPYAGGAGVALYLLINEICSTIHINDYDIAVYNFWKSILSDTEQFIKKIENIEVTIDEWEKQKLILNNPTQYSRLENGFATFFLNRTNHSGILKGGVIGGKKQNGKYKLDARFNKKNLIKRIERIASYKDCIKLYNEDACSLLSRVEEFLPSKSFIYLDPPYYEKGKGLYRNFYSHKDHERIQEVLEKVKYPWIVSYDNKEEIKEIYKNYIVGYYSLNYSISERRATREVVFFNKKIKIPTNTDILLDI